ncbi:DUF3999 family protein [Montanilutibacter psychrotolerans]|uniref:DUF3999 domain-containing protein n=1 Tax=Montanilutibacter psychrotolerans TaxID=1327343 RepID=A0A3M8SYM6_9GAMM|nr:DUF3999 family protein [Lysobacter psychrotolerans]RNF85933.1 DUF3999 domain-containing protein [Lysobacter psychrotolerans]
MKRQRHFRFADALTRLSICLVAAALPLVALAGAREDYAWQWPIQLQDGEGSAYRLPLDVEVYRQLRDPLLRDFDVIDRDGRPVPAALFAAPAQTGSELRVALPLFALPAATATAPMQGWELVSRADADGRLRSVEARVSGPQSVSLPRNVLVLDASQLKAPVTALELQWPAGGEVNLGYRLDASDDLDHWRQVAMHGRLVDLKQGGRALRNNRLSIDEDGLRSRYLRLIPERNDATLAVSAVLAVHGATTADAPLQWLALRGTRGSDAGWTRLEYDSGGPFPLTVADVELPDTYAIEWTLESRATPTAPWRMRFAHWMTFRDRQAGAGAASAPQVLGGLSRDRHWRLSTRAAVPGDPTLRLGYAPEAATFLAQGKPPYALVAGSARARRADSPMPRLIDAMRERHGATWRPSPATLGERQPLAGDAALVPLPPKRDWTTWSLWAVLVLGAVVVGGFALSLVRTPTDGRKR